ncbi:hypothetical protein TNIN_378361 [Trichonephila inaurata madagascariensis]|uniref:Uncharacterized protein n=1 Tax=Trichonephila inaurata madagascariensis TaxID=2747483 RepID=A0A8X7CC37_9ARAC|nr:hypothetical protein TNIN_378361 [Trichonephila inaurata madagascariensis]
MTRCSTIDYCYPLDRFEITNLTYNPKFESLEMFSSIGGYMGMWLGVSLRPYTTSSGLHSSSSCTDGEEEAESSLAKKSIPII